METALGQLLYSSCMTSNRCEGLPMRGPCEAL